MNKKRIFTVAASHLDTSWLWNLETTIREYIPATLERNFALFKKYPDYRFGFEGSYRYELTEEYYPELFAKLCDYTKEGKWTPVGSAYENGDVNIPSPEALFRNILYGNDCFEKKFGKPSNDIFLPDCFGFGYALPSIMAHAGLKGFSTGKLAWGSAYDTPFDLGKWYGVDGNFVYANLRPGSYSRSLTSFRKDKGLLSKLSENEKYDLPMTAAFYGTGDRGGAPAEACVKTIEKETKRNGVSDVEVLSVTSKELFEVMDNDLTVEQKKNLPEWNNELLLTNHGVGSYTSRTVGTRWNKSGERLADMAECSAAAAYSLCGKEYPQYTFDNAWKRIIAHQFHDDITGTSFQTCYKRNWNDYILSQNQFAEEFRAANEAVSEKLDTSFVKGIAVVVNNPTQFERCEAVTAAIGKNIIKSHVRVFDENGIEVHSQIFNKTICFMASVPPFGCRVYDVQPADKPYDKKTGLSIEKNTLENKNIRVKIDENGDIGEVFDKRLGRNVLSDKISMAVFDYKGSKSWPAWELTYNEVMAIPREYARNAELEIVEGGAARVTLKISRTAGKSRFTQLLSLDAESETLRVFNEVDWRSTSSLLKATFPLGPTNELASYDLGLGFIRRKTNTERLYEVPAQLWADISEADGSYGVSVLSDSRAGWDRPDENTLRLTAVHTPYYAYRWECSQHLMDLGLNRFSFGVFSHKGDVGAETQKAAQCFYKPMSCFVTNPHGGSLGNHFSFAVVNDNSVLVRAIKKAQNSDEIIVRFNECEGIKKENIAFEMGDGIVSAYEVYANEKFKSKAEVKDGKLVFDIGAFQPKSFAIKLKNNLCGNQAKYVKLDLPCDKTLLTCNKCRTNSELSIPKELIPESLVCGGVDFKINKGIYNALLCKGQKIQLPEGCKRVFLLACSLKGDKSVSFSTKGGAVKVNISDWQQAVGAWDLIGLGETGYIKRDVLAWNSTHAHSKLGDIPAKQLYLFKYQLDACGETLTLPYDGNVSVFAVTVALDDSKFETASELYDSLEKRPFDYEISDEERLKSQPSRIERIIDKVVKRGKSLTIALPTTKSTIQLADAYSFLRQIL